MIRFRLRELIAQKSFDDGRRITIDEISKATGISRNTLSRLANTKGYNSTTEVIDGLCNYFDCDVGQVIEHIKEENDSES